jgi:hypothetical protein
VCSRVVYVGADGGSETPEPRRGRGDSSRLERFEKGAENDGNLPSALTRLARRDVSCRPCWPHAAPDGRTAARKGPAERNGRCWEKRGAHGDPGGRVRLRLLDWSYL